MLLAVCWFVLLLFADMKLRPVERVWLMENHRAKEPKLHSLLPSAVSVEYLLCARPLVESCFVLPLSVPPLPPKILEKASWVVFALRENPPGPLL